MRRLAQPPRIVPLNPPVRGRAWPGHPRDIGKAFAAARGCPDQVRARTKSGIPLPVDAAEAEVFDLEEFLDAVVRALAADARFLHAAERRDLGRDDAFVDADDAVFQGLGDPPDAA